MKFVVISDTHGKHRELKLPKGDVIIHSGDFCHYGSNDNLYDFLLWYKELEFETKILIGGNHDFFAAEESEQFVKMLPKGIIYLNDSGFMLKGIKIWGSPVQPDLVGWAFGKNRGQEMKTHWDLIPKDIRILITHTPPHGILDKSRSGRSIGCEELSKKLNELNLKFHIFGHVHASYGTKVIGETKFINASNINSSKGLVNKPIIFDYQY
jgi:predicted phosphodiesterase